MSLNLVEHHRTSSNLVEPCQTSYNLVEPFQELILGGFKPQRTFPHPAEPCQTSSNLVLTNIVKPHSVRSGGSDKKKLLITHFLNTRGGWL